MPADGLTVASPLQAPQVVLVSEVMVTVIPGPSDTVVLELALQPSASVTVTLKVPLQSPVAVTVVCAPESFHKYAKGPVPLVVDTVDIPLHTPAQLASSVINDSVIAGGSVNVTLLAETHPKASVAATVNMPAESPVAVALVWDEGSLQT